jgi:CheY-like chemotaxis protein
VDDQASDSHLVKLYLEGTNDYLVREENNAELALAAAHEFQPHLILLDVLMPGIGGAALAASFRADPEFKALPIVFLTCVVSKEEVDLCGGQIGNYPFLAKPIVLPEVAACVKHHLGR